MNFLTRTQLQQLLANWQAQTEVQNTGRPELDFPPVVKLFTPDANATWLLTELDEDGDTAFGLCDLGLGYPELGIREPDRTHRPARPAGPARGAGQGIPA